MSTYKWKVLEGSEPSRNPRHLAEAFQHMSPDRVDKITRIFRNPTTIADSFKEAPGTPEPRIVTLGNRLEKSLLELENYLHEQEGTEPQ